MLRWLGDLGVRKVGSGVRDMYVMEHAIIERVAFATTVVVVVVVEAIAVALKRRICRSA